MNVFEKSNSIQLDEIMSELTNQRNHSQIDESIILATPSKASKPVPNLFSPPREHRPENIKEMFATQNKHSETVDETFESDASSIDQSQCLFKDPESTFDTSVSINNNYFLHTVIFLYLVEIASNLPRLNEANSEN